MSMLILPISIIILETLGESYMIKQKLFVYVAFILLLTQQSVYSQKQNAKTGCVWMWGKTFNSQPMDSIINNLKYNYVKEVYLLVKGERGTLTDSSNLHDFIAKAHANDIKVHFWYIVARDGKFLTKHPESCVYHCPNPALGFTAPYPDTLSEIHFTDINFFYPGYKEYMLKNMHYLITNFDCDGIHLDNIRYTDIFLSFDDYSLRNAESLGCNTKRLLELCNKDYDYYIAKGGLVKLYSCGDKDVVAWVNMRKNIIYDYVKSTKDLIETIKPGLPLTAAFLPEGADDPDLGDVYFAQNYAQNAPLLSMISPMSYFKDCGHPISWLKTITENAIKLVGPNCKIFNGIQTYNGVTTEQIEEEINCSLEGGAVGIIAFKYDSILPDDWKVIKKAFREMQGF